MLNQASAIKMANPYLYPLYSFMSFAYLTKMETFFEEITH